MLGGIVVFDPSFPFSNSKRESFGYGDIDREDNGAYSTEFLRYRRANPASAQLILDNLNTINGETYFPSMRVFADWANRIDTRKQKNLSLLRGEVPTEYETDPIEVERDRKREAEEEYKFMRRYMRFEDFLDSLSKDEQVAIFGASYETMDDKLKVFSSFPSVRRGLLHDILIFILTGKRIRDFTENDEELARFYSYLGKRRPYLWTGAYLDSPFWQTDFFYLKDHLLHYAVTDYKKPSIFDRIIDALSKTDYDSIIKPVISRGRHKRITDRSYYLPGGFPTGTWAVERRRMLAKKRRW